MTRIDFYFNVADKRQIIDNLVHSALSKRRQVTIYTDNIIMADKVSVDLWQNKPESFLPNVPADHALAAKTPIIIHWHENQLFQDDMLINLTTNEPIFFSRFTQLIELVNDVEEEKIAARQRYKFYRDRGYEIKSINYAQTNVPAVE
jgi:DNA polymerase III subunit chi